MPPSPFTPSRRGQWRTRYGLDVHGGGGFAPSDYVRPAFGAEYPYSPASEFAAGIQGKAPFDFPGHEALDYLGRQAGSGRSGTGHIIP